MSALIEDACNLAMRDSLFAGITFTRECDDTIVIVDAAQMALVLTSLLRNAAQVMPDGGHIHVGARHVHKTCIITITDSGPGIPPDQRKRVGEAFLPPKRRAQAWGSPRRAGCWRRTVERSPLSFHRAGARRQ